MKKISDNINFGSKNETSFEIDCPLQQYTLSEKLYIALFFCLFTKSRNLAIS